MRVDRVLTVLIFVEVFSICIATETPSNKSGLYTTTVLKAKKCEKPSSSYLKIPIFSVFIQQNVKNKNIIHGNVTFLQDTSLKINVQEFYSEAGKWQMTYNIKNLSCRSHFLSDLLDSIYIFYDKRTCVIPKGTFEIEADYNQVDHMWTSTREYGRMLRRVEVGNRAGTALCLEVEADVRPEK